METLEKVSQCVFSISNFPASSGQFSDISNNRNFTESLFGVIYGTTYLWFAIMSVYFNIVVQNS